MQGAILGPESLTGMQNLNFMSVLDEVKTTMPEMNWLVPFTFFVSNKDAKIDSFLHAKKFGSFAVMNYVEDDLEIDIVDARTGETIRGYCMDVFNKNLVQGYLTELLKPLEPYADKVGLYLYDNLPKVKQAQTTNKQSEIFTQRAFTPGGYDINAGSLPIDSKHTIDSQTSAYHYEMRGLFGTKFAY